MACMLAHTYRPGTDAQVRWLATLRFKCWVVTHRAAFMGTVAGLGVIGVSSGVVRMVYR